MSHTCSANCSTVSSLTVATICAIIPIYLCQQVRHWRSRCIPDLRFTHFRRLHPAFDTHSVLPFVRFIYFFQYEGGCRWWVVRRGCMSCRGCTPWCVLSVQLGQRNPMIDSPVSSRILSIGTALTTSRLSSVLREHPLIPM